MKTNVDQNRGLVLITNIWNKRKWRLLGDSQDASEEASSKPILLVSGDGLFERGWSWQQQFWSHTLGKGGRHFLGEMLCLELAAAVAWAKAAQWCSSPLWVVGQGRSNSPLRVPALLDPSLPPPSFAIRKLFCPVDFWESNYVWRFLL